MAPDSQRDSVEDFINLYNLLVDHMARTLRVESYTTFSRLLDSYIDRKPWVRREKDWLRKVADLRNAIEHERFEPYKYIAIPTPKVLDELRRVHAAFTNPPRAIPTFQRKVAIVAPDDSLATILKIVHENKFSQVPVYEQKNFRGLITENGLTRWISSHVVDRGGSVDFGKVTAREILQSEEKRKPWQFTSGKTEVGKIKQFFVDQRLLEAVIITTTGKKDGTPIGMASRWEIDKLG